MVDNVINARRQKSSRKPDSGETKGRRTAALVDKCLLISLYCIDRGSFWPVWPLAGHDGTLLRWRHRLGYFRHWLVFGLLRWTENQIGATAWQLENCQ